MPASECFLALKHSKRLLLSLVGYFKSKKSNVRLLPHRSFVSSFHYLEQISQSLKQHFIFLHQLITAIEKAMMANEPLVEPNWKRMLSAPMRTCVWYTPMRAAMETRRSRMQTTHLEIVHPIPHVLCFLAIRAIKESGKDKGTEFSVAGKKEGWESVESMEGVEGWEGLKRAAYLPSLRTILFPTPAWSRTLST